MSESPSAAIVTAFRALDARDWRALIAVLDPDAVAAFKTRQLQSLEMYETAPAGESDLLRHVFAVRSVAALRALPPAIVLRRWLRVRYGGQAGSLGIVTTVLGEIFEGADLAHVVFRRAEPPSTLFDGVRVVSVRRINGDWRVSLGGGLVVDESGGYGIGYSPGEVDPTEGEDDFLSPAT